MFESSGVLRETDREESFHLAVSPLRLGTFRTSKQMLASLQKTGCHISENSLEVLGRNKKNSDQENPPIRLETKPHEINLALFSFSQLGLSGARMRNDSAIKSAEIFLEMFPLPEEAAVQIILQYGDELPAGEAFVVPSKSPLLIRGSEFFFSVGKDKDGKTYLAERSVGGYGRYLPFTHRFPFEVPNVEKTKKLLNLQLKKENGSRVLLEDFIQESPVSVCADSKFI